MSRLVSATAFLALFVVASLHECRSAVPERWFFAYVDLLNSRTGCPARDNSSCNLGTQDMFELLPRLSDAGYSVVVLSNYYLASKPHLEGSHKDSCRFLENLGKIADAAAANGIELIPEVMVVGASGTVLANDPHLAEGAPVRGCKFKVKMVDGQLKAYVHDPNKDKRIVHGDFDAPLEDIRANLNLVCKDVTITQSTVTPSGTGKALLVEATPSGDCTGAPTEPPFFELFRKIDNFVDARHQYELSFQIKTKDFGFKQDGERGLNVELWVDDLVLGKRQLTRVKHTVNKTQEWTKYYVSFNTFQYHELDFSFSVVGIDKGRLWLDDLVMRKVGGVNLLRRDGCPVTVTNEDGDPYVEGTDFQPWIDPNVGIGGQYLPYAAAADETPIEDGIPIVVADSRFMEKDILLVSYYHAVLPEAAGHRVCCSLRHPKVLDLFWFQVERLNKLLAPKRWLIMHDEIRSMGHDEFARGDSPAKMLGEHLNWSVRTINELDPDGQIVLVSDMYDPFHNAVPEGNESSYYPFVQGSFCSSWKYIPQGTTIWNWSIGDGDLNVLPYVNGSLDHFQNRLGVEVDQVVAGFYDFTDRFEDADRKKQELKKLTRELFCVGRKYPTVKAVCYYTTKGNTDYIKDFADIATEVWTADPPPTCTVALPESACVSQ